jgi:molybdopterin-guanine dinucleotide biosynthesis protein A
MSQRVGVVLAGGAGRRLGRRKAELEFDGVTLAERAAGVLWPHCASVLISVESGAANPAPAHAAIEDSPPAGRGPLAGILAAFEATSRSDLMILACDYPRVGPDLLRRILAFDSDEYDLVMPTDARGRDHPLVALWSRRTEEHVRRALEGGLYKVRSLLVEWRVKRLSPVDLRGIDTDRALLNVNRPEDIEALRAADSDRRR